jgi:hypothetical protein
VLPLGRQLLRQVGQSNMEDLAVASRETDLAVGPLLARSLRSENLWAGGGQWHCSASDAASSHTESFPADDAGITAQGQTQWVSLSAADGRPKARPAYMVTIKA